MGALFASGRVAVNSVVIGRVTPREHCPAHCKVARRLTHSIKLGELAGAGHALSNAVSYINITGLTADSREVAPGVLFAALPGTLTDGAKYIPQAIQRGASAILLPEGSPAVEGLELPVIEEADPRRALALMAARLYAPQPKTIIGVTGTSGKTSIVSFVRELWQGMGISAASLGTVGIDTPTGPRDLKLTTPDPVMLHKALAELAVEGITHLALEASSHGLQQRRLDGVQFAAVAFTNLTRDHLDYHATFDEYLEQKLRLFDTLLGDGRPVVINADSDYAKPFLEVAKARNLPTITIGEAGETLKIAELRRDGFAQRLVIVHDGISYEINLPLVGGFQASNALVAAGLCLACGADIAEILPHLAQLKGAKGRLEHIGTSRAGASVFVDYSHKPDALAKALEALRPYVKNRLVVVFGCGGDRDRGKRPEMGKIACELADLVFVTDDNPRGEDPAAIRAEILKEAPGAKEIGDRGEAIMTAVSGLQEGDVLLVAGKGHETGQTIAGEVIPFSDQEAVVSALEGSSV
jgi:UDP-N-acetylmuramoyl-L-alanyl-D-glutamate--2,6-diaminopimelate ligase